MKDGEIMHVVEKIPQFPGGLQAQLKYLEDNPRHTKEETAQCRVVVQMIIRKDGGIDDVKVVRDINKVLDLEAIKVIKNMPKR